MTDQIDQLAVLLSEYQYAEKPTYRDKLFARWLHERGVVVRPEIPTAYEQGAYRKAIEPSAAAVEAAIAAFHAKWETWDESDPVKSINEISALSWKAALTAAYRAERGVDDERV